MAEKTYLLVDENGWCFGTNSMKPKNVQTMEFDDVREAEKLVGTFVVGEKHYREKVVSNKIEPDLTKEVVKNA